MKLIHEKKVLTHFQIEGVEMRIVKRFENRDKKNHIRVVAPNGKRMPIEIKKGESIESIIDKSLKCVEYYKSLENENRTIIKELTDTSCIDKIYESENTIELIENFAELSLRSAKVTFKPAYDDFEKLNIQLSDEQIERLKTPKIEVFHIIEDTTELLEVLKSKQYSDIEFSTSETF